MAQVNYEKALVKKLYSYKDDPVGFAKVCFDWSQLDVPRLENWQIELFEAVKHPGKYAVASGHGIKKTSSACILILWFLSTRVRPKIVCTANTATQLLTTFWRELAIWHNRAINKHWFDWTATRLSLKASRSTHYAAAIPWSENNAQSFAGAHGDDVLIIFDEASTIPPVIYETALGAMTSGRCHFLCLGNPTHIDTPFEECFQKDEWTTWSVDSRSCVGTNKELLQSWVDEYGPDSDFVRVRVKGQFPRSNVDQFIADDLAQSAYERILGINEYIDAPDVLGVDIARFGNDETVLIHRKGQAIIDKVKYRGKDTMYTVNKVAQMMRETNFAGVFIDEGAMGAGVIDRLRELHFKVTGVNFGGKPANIKYLNKRAEMWGDTKKWLETGSIAGHKQLRKELTMPEYFYTSSGKVQLEGKTKIKKSPDEADALALTFALPVRPVNRVPKVKKEWNPW